MVNVHWSSPNNRSEERFKSTVVRPIENYFHAALSFSPKIVKGGGRGY